jgi:asparagine synthase (glutamine-hydrolysing)
LLDNPEAVIAFTSAPAFTTPPEKKFGFFAEESELAADVATKYGLRHVVVRSTASIPDTIRKQTSLLQQPLRDPFNGAWWLEIEARAAAMGATRLLTGELGNLTINAGNLTDLSEWIRRRRWLTWFNQARAASARPDAKWRGVLYSSFRLWIPPAASTALERIFMGHRPSEKISFVRPEWRSLRKRQRPPNNYAERLSIIREADSATVRKAALAQHGIEESDPFSDRRLIEFAFRIPPDQLYWNGVQRPLMREALADRLPASLFKKFGRGLQSGDWALWLSQAEAFGLLEEISSSHVAQDLLDLDRMRRAIERWPSNNWNEPSAAQEYRLALFDAVGVGMFAAAYD